MGRTMNILQCRQLALAAAVLLLFVGTACRPEEELGYVETTRNLKHAEAEMDAIGRPEGAALGGPRANSFRSGGAYSGESVVASNSCTEVIRFYESRLGGRGWSTDPERLGTHARGTYYYVRANTNWRAVLEIRTDSDGPPCAYLFAVFLHVK